MFVCKLSHKSNSDKKKLGFQLKAQPDIGGGPCLSDGGSLFLYFVGVVCCVCWGDMHGPP